MSQRFQRKAQVVPEVFSGWFLPGNPVMQTGVGLPSARTLKLGNGDAERCEIGPVVGAGCHASKILPLGYISRPDGEERTEGWKFLDA